MDSAQRQGEASDYQGGKVGDEIDAWKACECCSAQEIRNDDKKSASRVALKLKSCLWQLLQEEEPSGKAVQK